jgi:hypothetical protein
VEIKLSTQLIFLLMEVSNLAKVELSSITSMLLKSPRLDHQVDQLLVVLRSLFTEKDLLRQIFATELSD